MKRLDLTTEIVSELENHVWKVLRSRCATLTFMEAEDRYGRALFLSDEAYAVAGGSRSTLLTGPNWTAIEPHVEDVI